MKSRILALIFAVILCLSTACTAFAYNEDYRLVDGADLLFDFEEVEIANKLDEVSEELQLDIVIVTTDDIDGYTMQSFADDFYDYNGYGYGDSHDGVLLLVNMEDRDWCVSTTGYGITAITDAGLDYMSEQFVPYLSDGDYVTAFNTFIDLCDEFVTQAYTGEPYDVGNLPFSFKINFLYILFGLVTGVIISFIIVSIMKSQLKSVRSQAAAKEYVTEGSMKLTEQRDLFLYSKVDRRKKQKSSGGSSTHSGSSRTSHGGGVGSF